MELKQFYVYIMASGKRGTLYTGVTSDLVTRVVQHKEHYFPDSFTARYNVNRLVWYEIHDGAETAIRREKQIKEWRRAWKVEMIQRANPTWRDLIDDIVWALHRRCLTHRPSSRRKPGPTARLSAARTG